MCAVDGVSRGVSGSDLPVSLDDMRSRGREAERYITLISMAYCSRGGYAELTLMASSQPPALPRLVMLCLCLPQPNEPDPPVVGPPLPDPNSLSGIVRAVEGAES